MPGHVGPVAAVAINELTGDIVTCAGAWLYLWDVNGRPIAKVNTAPHVSRPLRSGKHYTMGSRYLEFRIMRPLIWCFIIRTNSFWNTGGLVIRKIRAIPVFVRISRPMIEVSLSGQIPDNEILFLAVKRLYKDKP